MLDKATRRNLRSITANLAGLTYDGIETKGIRNYEKADGALWPFSDAFVKRLIQVKYPKLSTNPKHAAAGRDLFTLIFSYYRLGLPAAEIAKARRTKLKTIESQIQRLEAMAAKIIIHGGFRAESGESYFPSRRKTSPARNIVKDCTVVTQRASDLHYLLGLADQSIREQARKALDEIRAQEQEIQKVCDGFNLLPLAA